jgi:hypothetical protein
VSGNDDGTGLPDNIVPFPAKKPAPPVAERHPPDPVRMLHAIGVVVDETHDGLVSVGHNTVVLADMLKEMGDIMDAHSVALNHIIQLLESGWARKDP